jgi:hypothetical protein
VPALCAPRIDEANHVRDGDQALLSDGRGGGRAHKTSEKLALVYMDGGPRKTAPIERAESKARFPFSSGWLVGKKKKVVGRCSSSNACVLGVNFIRVARNRRMHLIPRFGC